MAVRQRPQRPKLLSFGAFVPQQPESYAGGLLVSCRALQSILGGAQLAPSQHAKPLSTTTETAHAASPFAPRPSAHLQSPPRFVKAPRGVNKRRRNEYEEDQQDKENIPHGPEDRELYQTPKRQRRVPLDIPPGLKASDFVSLTTPVALPTPRRERDELIEMPPFSGGDEYEYEDQDENEDGRHNDDHHGYAHVRNTGHAKCRQSPQHRTIRSRSRPTIAHAHPSPPPDPGLPREAKDEHKVAEEDPVEDNEESSQDQWSPFDDRRLVEVVLSKLNLSKRDWNDCAKQLGKDKDSLDRRWRMLIGEGNIGLRRGLGRHERGDLDITSW